MKSEIAALLLEIKAVFLSPQAPFTWASGIKSPIYCDNRLILSYPKVRDRVEDGLVQLIKTHYPDAEAIIGTATAASPMRRSWPTNWPYRWVMPEAKPKIMEEPIRSKGSSSRERR